MGRKYKPTFPWGEVHSERFFSVTADQDWAPEWATRYMLNWARSLAVPVHVFQTNTSPTLAAANEEGAIGLGWHPNFGVGSTHGKTPREVASHMRRNYPGATTFRSHGFSESYEALVALADVGMAHESQYPTAFSAHIVPSVHASGLVRLPVWFEDDIWMRLAPHAESIEKLDRSFDSPGLKILNLHPIHIALNAPSDEYYERYRDRIYSTTSDDPIAELGFTGIGVRDIVESILKRAHAEGETLYRFDDLATRVGAIAMSNGSASPLIGVAGSTGQHLA